MCERTIAKCEEELCPTKEAKEQQHQLLDVYYKKHHQVVLHRTDVCEEQLLPEKQECSFRMVKEDPSKSKTRRHRPPGVSFSSLTSCSCTVSGVVEEPGGDGGRAGTDECCCGVSKRAKKLFSSSI
nr:uncharacterized protein LOC133575823 isoform X3 [Nerophis lumbriciformis]